MGPPRLPVDGSPLLCLPGLSGLREMAGMAFREVLVTIACLSAGAGRAGLTAGTSMTWHAKPRRGSATRSDSSARRLVAGFPFADFREAPALLCGCGAVPAGSAAFKAFGDPGAVLLRVAVVVFELGGNAGDVQAQAADS
jgi:hypothetical protein